MATAVEALCCHRLGTVVGQAVSLPAEPEVGDNVVAVDSRIGGLNII